LDSGLLRILDTFLLMRLSSEPEARHADPGRTVQGTLSTMSGELRAERRADKAKPVTVIFHATDDTVEMLERILGDSQQLVPCRFFDIKKGTVDFAQFLAQHNPDAAIFDISRPYAENWQFYKTVRSHDAICSALAQSRRVAKLPDKD
jgi:hypothetical protein